MGNITTHFVTKLYRSRLEGAATLNRDLGAACAAIAKEDKAGRRWSRENGYKGYTSYASLDDLPTRDPAFGALKKHLDKHVAAFSRALHLDLNGGKLVLDSMWINVLEPGGVHTGHLHPHSAISGTYYVSTPLGASALKFEDPRLPLMMAAPQRAEDAPDEEQTFVYVEPRAGEVLLWESFIRHEVPPNDAKRARVSVSFNYGW